MKSVFKIYALVALLGLNVTACDDQMSTGSSLVEDEVQVIVDTTFTTTGYSISGQPVLSRTITGILGRIEAPDYGNLTSDFVTQFMPSIALDTVGVNAGRIDAVKLVMRYEIGGFTGDSLAPMGLEVYRLNKQLPSPIYSDFDPSGYYDVTPIASKVYTASEAALTDSLLKLKYREIKVDLPIALGRELYDKYIQDPAAYSEPESFAKIFPGLYLKNSYGSGRITRLVKTTIDFDYHSVTPIDGTDRDTTIYKTSSYFAVTPEIIANNNINMSISKDIRDSIAKGQTIVMAPAGLDVEMTFPARELLDTYNAKIKGGLGVINTLTYTIPAKVIENKYNIAPPPFLLMVLKKDRDKFFAENKLTDEITSFYATYNETSGQYYFGSMFKYIQQLQEKGEITDEDVTFVITPVLVSLEMSDNYYDQMTYVTSITPYVAKPVMVNLEVAKAKINFVYSSQKLSN